MHSLRITHSHLWSWPEVRRGAERELHELSRRQALAGHDVRVVAGTRRGGMVSRDRTGPVPVTRVRVPRLNRFTDEALWAASALPALAASSGDLLHAWHYGDGAAATLVRRGRPLVLKITGCVPRGSAELKRPDRALLERALHGASEVWVNDDWVVAAMSDWDVPMVVVPPGVDTDLFRPGGSRAEAPTVLAVGPLSEPRKRLSVLVGLWEQVLAKVPEARLQLAGAATPNERTALLDSLPSHVRASITLLGSLPSEQLLEAYRTAWVFAAPAGDEAFGLAVVEALATGTPVVGTRSGATPRLVSSPELGSTHPLDDPSALADGLIARLQAPPTDIDAVARAVAVARHGWGTRVADVEARYQALLDG